MPTLKLGYQPTKKDERLSPEGEKNRENARYKFIIKNHKTMNINTMAKSLKIGYAQVSQRVQRLRKMGFDIPSLRRKGVEPNWELLKKFYKENSPAPAKKK